MSIAAHADHRHRKMPELAPSEANAWMSRARCRGAHPADFFPTDGLGVEHTQQLCRECPVCSECLEHALTNRINYGTSGVPPRSRVR